MTTLIEAPRRLRSSGHLVPSLPPDDGATPHTNRLGGNRLAGSAAAVLLGAAVLAAVRYTAAIRPT